MSNKLTDKDFEAAQAIDTLAGGGDIKMEDYTYNLDPTSIATHPAYPRGSSKLLQVDEKGSLSFHSTFGETFPSLSEGAHIVLNESRVLAARLFVVGAEGEQTEMMILDIGDLDIKLPCKDIQLNVMLRTSSVNVGDIFEVTGGGKVEIVGIKGYVGKMANALLNRKTIANSSIFTGFGKRTRIATVMGRNATSRF
mmetsp:Transcript_649/g.1076  ORF Transcript_649/g.1076 Transcript_649/m.1076 type:complete len:196 (-) Transcript_649:3098-3685(-)